MIVDAFWLPGLDTGLVHEWDTREYGGATLRWPVLDPSALRGVIATIRQARADVLARTTTADIVQAIDSVARRLADRADPLRRTAEDLLPAVTGYAPAMIRLGLERMVPDWRQPALEGLLRAELGDPGALDGFVPDLRTARPAQPAAGDPPGARRLVHATGPELAFHVFAGNVPGVAVTSIVRSLLVKAATLGKTAAGEPLLPALFARGLADVAPEIAAALAVTYWPGGTTALEDVPLADAGAVVVYGGEDALAAMRARANGASIVIDHGPRYSFGVVTREALAEHALPGLAASIARAVAIFDQQGCVSPHLVYAERGGDVRPERLADSIATAIAELEPHLPRGRISPEEAVSVHNARATAEFREIAGADVRLHAGANASFTVAYDADPAFAPSCLNRFLWVKPVDDQSEVVQHVKPFARYLQTVAVAGTGPRLRALAGALAAAGASRITTFDDAPWPPAEWHHDGHGPLLELLRWTDLELRAEARAQNPAV